MRNRKLQGVLAFLALGVTAVIAAPTITSPSVRNNLLQPAIMAEASFPATTSNTIGAFLFGTTAGAPYWSPGDGGSWQTFGVSSGYSRTSSGITTLTRQLSEGQKVFFADAGTSGTNGTIVIVNTQNPTGGVQSNIAFANPDPSGTIVIGGTCGYDEDSPVSGTTGTLRCHAGVGRGIQFDINGSSQIDCHGGSCGIGGSSALGNPAQYTLSLQDIGAGDTLRVAVTSGNDAVQVSSNGGRIHFGSGASDYCSSDGTTVTFAGPIATASTADISPGRNIIVNAGNIQFDNKLTFSDTAATVTTACSSPTITHGVSTSFQVDVGTSCATGTIVLGLPTASNGWECHGYNKTTATMALFQSADTTASATLLNTQKSDGVTTNFVDGADLVITCTGR